MTTGALLDPSDPGLLSRVVVDLDGFVGTIVQVNRSTGNARIQYHTEWGAITYTDWVKISCLRDTGMWNLDLPVSDGY